MRLLGSHFLAQSWSRYWFPKINHIGLQVKVNDAAADRGRNVAMYPTSSRGSFLKGELSRLCRLGGGISGGTMRGDTKL